MITLIEADLTENHQKVLTLYLAYRKKTRVAMFTEEVDLTDVYFLMLPMLFKYSGYEYYL